MEKEKIKMVFSSWSILNYLNLHINIFKWYHCYSIIKLETTNKNKINSVRNSEEKKFVIYKSKLYPSLINPSFKNKQIEESVAPQINNNINKTSSAFSIRNKDPFYKDSMRKIRKYYTNKKINFSKSAVNFNKRKKNEMKSLKSSKEKKSNRNKELILNEDKISQNIFNNLDKIQKTLLLKYQQNYGMKDGNDMMNLLNKLDKKENDNDNSIIPSNGLNRILNRNKKNLLIKKNNQTYDSVTIKSKSGINFFSKNISKTLFLRRNNSVVPKRLHSTIERSPKHITRFLERKIINDIPVTYPLYISHNNRYSSMSEKNRVDRILSKLICLQTHIIRDNLNKFEIIKEFLSKNGFKDEKYFRHESLNNFYHYLLKPFTFPPEYILADVINEGIKYKPQLLSDEIDKSEDQNFLNYSPKKENFVVTDKKKNKTRNIMNKSYSAFNVMMDNKYIKPYISSDNDNIVNKTLPVLIQDLESELRQIRLEKMSKLDKYNNLLSKKMDMVKIVDKNKYIPNLCLISRGFKEKCKENIDKINRKIIRTKNKQEKLKEINNRLYYDIIRRHNLAEFDRVDIQRKLKLTEFVVMERAKKRYLFENAKNNYVNILKKIRLFKANKQAE